MTRNVDMEQVAGDFYTENFAKDASEGSLILNLGPQHPSTHGVLRVIVELDGEYVLRAEPVIGYLHRMHEKMAEVKTAAQFIPNMGRVDYGHAIAWNWAFVGAVERLAGIEVPPRAEYVRVITCELNRIASHLLWWGAYLLDLGAFTPIMYAFDDREKILDILQSPTGARLTFSYFRIGGVARDLDEDCLKAIREFIPWMRSRLPMYKEFVSDNIILRRRIEGVGVFEPDLCRRYGASGPVSRGSGLAYDVRRDEPYSVYPKLDFEVPTSELMDARGRYDVRMEEMAQSLNIIERCLEQMPEGDTLVKGAPKPSWKVPKGEAYFAVEGGRGKIGAHVVSDGGKNMYRVKLRSPSYSNLSLFAEASRGTLLADAVAILGSLDLIIPEIDR